MRQRALEEQKQREQQEFLMQLQRQQSQSSAAAAAMQSGGPKSGASTAMGSDAWAPKQAPSVSLKAIQSEQEQQFVRQQATQTAAPSSRYATLASQARPGPIRSVLF